MEVSLALALLCLPLTTYGICFLVKDAKITKPIRDWFSICRFFRCLFRCAFCVGIWCSLVTSSLTCLIFSRVISWWFLVFWIPAGAVVCYAIDLKLLRWEIEAGVNDEADDC